MKTIKLWDGIRVTTATDSDICKTPQELWDTLHMSGDEYDEMRRAVMTDLFCCGKCDLTEAYHGFTVILTTYTKEG